MRFIFINRFYWPEERATAQLLTDLAETLVAHGHTVTVITSCGAARDLARTENRRGVQIHRVGGRHHQATKLFSFISFSIAALNDLAATAQPGDVVVPLTDPPLIGIGAWIVARLKRAHIFHWVHDIYPEIAITVTGHTWLRIFRPIRNLAWRRSDGCIALSRDLAATIQRAGVSPSNIHLSLNWAPSGLGPRPSRAANALREEWNLVEKFVALYSGNLGRVHDLEPLLDVAERLLPHPQLALVFVGAGAQLATLTASAKRRRLDNVQFHPSQPRERLAETIALGDVHFVTLRPGCESAVFPSKLYGIAAIGRPTIVVASSNSELSGIINAHGFGRAFTRIETDAMADHILALSRSPTECARQSSAALNFFEIAGGVDRAAREWAALAETLPQP